MDQNLTEEIPSYKKDEPKPKNGPGDDLNARVKGLEAAKQYEGMTKADIDALDRSIAKLKAKMAEKVEAKKENEGM